MSNFAIVLLGSNISPLSNIPKALKKLDACFGSYKLSHLYESPPIKRNDTNNYYNIAIAFETSLPAIEMKYEYLRKIEGEIGRQRTEDKYAPREIDLDLILLGEQIINTDTIILPDPEITKYLHVALPLLDLLPDWADPTTGERLDMIVKNLPGKDSIFKRPMDLLEWQN